MKSISGSVLLHTVIAMNWQGDGVIRGGSIDVEALDWLAGDL